MFGIMKWVRIRYGITLLLAAVAIIMIITFGRARRPLPYGKSCLQVSTPVFGNYTSADHVGPGVSFCVSNLGPRQVEFQVRWFECRTERERTLLATNQLEPRTILLSAGRSTNLIVGVWATVAPEERQLSGYCVWWWESEPAWRRWARSLDRPANWLFNIFDLNYNPPWHRPTACISGSALACNIGVADYFRVMYGWTRQTWLEDLARMESARTGAIHRTYLSYRARPPTAEDLTRQDARGAFAVFCQSFTNGVPDAEPAAAPNAAPPHR
jgi:hypothetical protein